MTIKLDRFCLLLKDVENEVGVDPSEVSSYLLENLLYPFLAGKDVGLGDLDYDAFSLDDLDVLIRHTREMENVCHKTSVKAERLQKSAPAVRLLRAFC